MAQLFAQAGMAASVGSPEDLLAQLNREPDPDPMADVDYNGTRRKTPSAS